jgi:formylmethanofuran dehydrogenase subunit B
MDWTCPFCPLLCDRFGIELAPQPRLLGSDCPRALAGLANFPGEAPAPRPAIDGQECSLDEAVAAAARMLGASRQPLFGGLATDVAGTRALYRLAAASGAICDPAGGAALMHGLRSLQDRGQFTTTLAEVRGRADVIVCLGASPTARYPEFFRRIDIGTTTHVAQRHIAFVGADPDPALHGLAGTSVEPIALAGDLYRTTALLSALASRRAVRDAPATLAALAERLLGARYGVIVTDAASLPAHGALILEVIERLVATLNSDTRAGWLSLGGGDGASTVNQVFAWLSGLPLRSRVGARGIEHEPIAFDARRLLDDGAVDALLWLASFGPEPAPPEVPLPAVVLGHPAAARPAQGVFIPVATPGIGSAGHLFRTDGVVLMPLVPLRPDPLPSAAEVLARIDATLRSSRS